MATCNPNGGEMKPLPDNRGKVPARQHGDRVTHTDLQVPGGADDPKTSGPRSPGRMPRRMAGGRQTQPYRR